MRELELKEKKIKEIQSTGDRLLREDHPARATVEVGAVRGPLVLVEGVEGYGDPRSAHDGGEGYGRPSGCLWWGRGL